MRTSKISIFNNENSTKKLGWSSTFFPIRSSNIWYSGHSMNCRHICLNILLKISDISFSMFLSSLFSYTNRKKNVYWTICIQTFSFNCPLIHHSTLLVLRSEISRTMTCWLDYANHQLLSDSTVFSSFSLDDFTLLQYGDKLSATLTANNDTAFRVTEEFCATVA